MSLTYLEQTARARALYLEGQPQQDIARALGVSETTVTNWKKKGAWPVPPREAAAIAQRKSAFTLFREGNSQQDIAQQLGISENTVSSWKKKFHWVARIALIRDKAIDESLAQISEVVKAQVSRYRADLLPRQAQALEWALSYVCQQLDREESATL